MPQVYNNWIYVIIRYPKASPLMIIRMQRMIYCKIKTQKEGL